MVVQYNCAKCPGYCCSYPVIALDKRDLNRIARYFDMTPEKAEKRYTRKAHGYDRIMKRKKDLWFGKICQFFEVEHRVCTIYEARPSTCRDFPGSGRCGYYDFLCFERRGQEDPEYVSTTDHNEE